MVPSSGDTASANSETNGWRFVFAALVYAALGAWWLWPLPVDALRATYDFTSTFPLLQADFNLISWATSWSSHALVTRPTALFDANIYHPFPRSLAFADHFVGLVPIFGPAYWATGNPIFATNATILLSQPLCAMAMYLLARRFVPPHAAFLAGFSYGFFPFRFQLLAHYHVLAVFWLPLCLLALDRWLERGHWRDAALLALFTFLQGATSFYLAYAAAFAISAYLLIALCLGRYALGGHSIVGVLAALAVSFGALAGLAIPYLVHAEQGFIPSTARVIQKGSEALAASASAAGVLRYFTEESVGPLGLLCVAAALVPPWRSAVAIAAGLALVAVGAVVAQGPYLPLGSTAVWSPFHLLLWLPGFAAVRVLNRFLVVAQLGLAILVAVGFARLAASLGKARWACALAMVVGTLWWQSPLLRVGAPIAAEPLGTDPPEYALWLAKNGGGRALVELPAAPYPERTRRMLVSTFHWLPLVDGYSSYGPRAGQAIQWAARRLPEPSALRAVLDLTDVGWVLVHLSQLPEEERRRWVDAPLPAGLERAHASSEHVLIRVTARGDFARQARLTSETETLNGVPIRRLRDCRGAIALIGSPEWRAGSDVILDLAIRNDTPESWPGAGFLPNHLLALQACFASPGDTCVSQANPLDLDVPAESTVHTRVRKRTPDRPGRYRLTATLSQIGDGSLEQCGFAALSQEVTVD